MRKSEFVFAISFVLGMFTITGAIVLRRHPPIPVEYGWCTDPVGRQGLRTCAYQHVTWECDRYRCALPGTSVVLVGDED